MHRVFALITTLAIAFSPSLWAQGDPVTSLEQAKKLSEAAMTAAARGTYEESLAPLKAYTPMSEEEFTKFSTQITEQLEGIEQRLDAPTGYGFIETVEVGDFIRSFHYALKYPNGIVRWNFVFYRPEKDWLFHYMELEAIAPIRI
jgi:hypothetical protein